MRDFIGDHRHAIGMACPSLPGRWRRFEIGGECARYALCTVNDVRRLNKMSSGVLVKNEGNNFVHSLETILSNILFTRTSVISFC